MQNDKQAEYDRNRERNVALVMERKSEPCADCKLLWHPAAMTFDHRRRDTKWVSATGRRMQPNRMLTYEPNSFRIMLDNCDAVCRNCHSIREMLRDGILSKPQWREYTRELKAGALRETVAHAA